MADTHQIRCPQCATLYDEGEARCPHCGLPAEPAARQRHIEQLLEHTAAGPAAGAPVVVLTLVIGAVRSTTASFRSSPERLVAGLQKALDDKDVRLFAELALPAGTSYESSDYSRIAASDLPNLQLELVEVFSGRKDTYALAIVRYTERESLSPGDGQMEVLMLSKTDGKWYNSNTTNAFLRGLLGTVDYSYQYDPDSYDDPYAVPD